MFRIILKGIFIMIAVPLISCNFLTRSVNGDSLQNDRPQILKYETSPYPIKHRWVHIPEGDGTLTITLYAKNTKKARFYLIPTGTGTYNQRKLIGEALNKNGVFQINWKYGATESILYHVDVEAIGYNQQIVRDIPFNVARSD